MYEAVRQQQSRKMKLICNAVDYVRSPPPNPSIAPSRALHNSPHALLQRGKNITMDERACLDTALACWPLPLLAGSGCQVPGALALAGGAGSTSVAPARSELACAGCVGVQVCVCVWVGGGGGACAHAARPTLRLLAPSTAAAQLWRDAHSVEACPV